MKPEDKPVETAQYAAKSETVKKCKTVMNLTLFEPDGARLIYRNVTDVVFYETYKVRFNDEGDHIVSSTLPYLLVEGTSEE